DRKVRLFAQRSRRRVFVIADAPRPGVETDAVTRAIIDGVDWPCQLLRARSRGCDDRCRCSSRCVIRKKNRERDGRSLRPGKFFEGITRWQRLYWKLRLPLPIWLVRRVLRWPGR